MAKINVMHIVPNLQAGGLQSVVVNLVNNFESDLFNLSICSLKQDGLFKNQIKRGIEIIELDKQEGNDFSIPIKLMCLFKKKKIDIVHTHNWSTLCEGVIGAKLAGIPITIHQEHGTVVAVITAKKIRMWLQKFIFRFVTQIIVVSSNLKKSMVEVLGVNEKKITVITNGINIQAYENKNEREKIRKELGIENYKVIGTIGRLVEVKDHKTLLYAMQYILKLKDFLHLKLVIIGDGHLKDKLIKLTTDLNLNNNIIFLGEQADIPKLLNIMDIFVLPSLYEGISITLLEAMAAGLPVIATNVGGNSEVVINNQTGILVPPQKPIALAKAIINILKDTKKAKEYGLAGKKRVEDKFNIRNVVKDYERLYKFYNR